jgi:hypothetical protein
LAPTEHTGGLGADLGHKSKVFDYTYVQERMDDMAQVNQQPSTDAIKINFSADYRYHCGYVGLWLGRYWIYISNMCG